MLSIYNQFVQDYIIDTRWWAGESPSFNDMYLVRNVALILIGVIWAFFFAFLYEIIDRLSMNFFSKYKTLNKVQKTDWSSRWVAIIFILLVSWLCIPLLNETGHILLPVKGIDMTTLLTAEWRINTQLNDSTLLVLWHIYCVFFGYELYDLKNCWDIKMYSGVIHHIVLLIIFPAAWSVTAMSILGAYMTATTYLTNIPAHIRSFMVHTGYRDTKFYHWNKWAWWVSYVILRLFSIPWFSSMMYYSGPVMVLQAPKALIAWYVAAMTIHYALSLYWFVEMTKTMFPPDARLQRVGSYPIIPKVDDSKQKHNSKFSQSKSSDSEDEGGQKFD